MTEHSPALTSEQVQEINKLIDDAKKNLVSSITTTVEKKQTEMIDAAKTEIDQAVVKNQRLILATVEAGVEKSVSSLRSKIWEGFKVVFPVLATAFLGFLVWKWQAEIQTKIDHQTEVVKAQLAFKGEFAKRKLDAYQEILNQMVDVGSKVHGAQHDEEMKAKLGPALLKFNETVKSKRLYMSHDAFQSLLDYWQAGIDVFRGKATLDDFRVKNSNAEDKIAQDLDVQNLGKLNLE